MALAARVVGAPALLLMQANAYNTTALALAAFKRQAVPCAHQLAGLGAAASFCSFSGGTFSQFNVVEGRVWLFLASNTPPGSARCASSKV